MKPSELERAFATIDLLADYVPGDFTIRRLDGLTNLNFHLCNAAHDWVLRIPRAATNMHIDRAAEAHNQALAVDLGIAPEPIWRDSSGLMLTPTLCGSRPAGADDLAVSGRLESILEPVRRLHRSGAPFLGRVALGELLERYYALLSQAAKHRYRVGLERARRMLPLLEKRDYSRVPSHNDLVLSNLLLETERTWIIDWEFSAMASPYWDLATLCNAADLDEDASRLLLQVYCTEATAMEESLLFDYRDLLGLLDDCWMAALIDNES